MALYQAKAGARLPVAAQIIGEECERLERDGILTPQALLDASRPEDAPLHSCFEWDDSIAAEEYRKSQSAHLIRSIVKVVDDYSEPVRAFTSVTVSEEKPMYVSVERALSDEEMREQVLARAKAELRSFSLKYKHLKELADVIAAIGKVVGDD